jgi:hypothetical protein
MVTQTVIAALMERGLTQAEAERECKLYACNCWLSDICGSQMASFVVDGVDAFTLDSFEETVEEMSLVEILSDMNY